MNLSHYELFIISTPVIFRILAKTKHGVDWNNLTIALQTDFNIENPDSKDLGIKVAISKKPHHLSSHFYEFAYLFKESIWLRITAYYYTTLYVDSLSPDEMHSEAFFLAQKEIAKFISI